MSNFFCFGRYNFGFNATSGASTDLLVERWMCEVSIQEKGEKSGCEWNVKGSNCMKLYVDFTVVVLNR